MDIADDADDLPRRLIEFRSDAFADGDARAQGISFRPKLFGQRLVNDDDAIRVGGVLLGERAAA